MIKKIEKKVEKAIKEKVFPGCVVGVIAKDKRLVLPFGNFTYDENSTPIQQDSIFDVASVTKSIPTASLALKLIEEGKLSIEDKVIKYIPELQNSYRDQVLVKHLLTHTIYYKTKSLSSLKDKSPKELMTIIFNFDYRQKPGIYYAYTNANSILLGLIIERIAGKSLDKLSDQEFFEQLGMDKTTFHPDGFKKKDVVPTEHDDWRGRLIQGEVHDESAWKLGKEKPVGSAGLFTTVPDLLSFLEMLINGGEYKGIKFFKKETLKLMYTNQIKHLGLNHGLGWELYQRRYMGKRAGPNTFGKTGFTGCSVVCDVPRQMGLVLLSNYVYPKRKPNADQINEARKDMADIVFESL